MQHTFGRLLDMGRLIARPAPQLDSDADNETPWRTVDSDVHYADLTSKTVCIIAAESDRTRWQTDAEERERIAADGHGYDGKVAG